MNKQELKDLFNEELKVIWDSPKMVDYCLKKSAGLVELNNGEYISIEKPRINKDFCFGHGYCGVSTEEDENRARDMYHTAKTSTDYFMDENLKGINSTLDRLSDPKNEVYVRRHYTGQPVNCFYRSYTITDVWSNPEHEPFRWNEDETRRKITDEERQAIIAGVEEVKKGCVKRLNTYLKKYGLSKVNAWTYLRD